MSKTPVVADGNEGTRKLLSEESRMRAKPVIYQATQRKQLARAIYSLEISGNFYPLRERKETISVGLKRKRVK